MNLDWIAWYYTILLAIDLVEALILHGQPRDNYDFRNNFVGLCIGIPIIGRMWNLW